MFKQSDPAWGGRKLDGSKYTMAQMGCLVTVNAQALALSGRGVDPGTLCNALNNGAGFTSGGLMYWNVVQRLFPGYVFGGQGYKFIEGNFYSGGKAFVHWILERNGKFYEPALGRVYDSIPGNFKPTGKVRTASITDVGVPVPTPPINKPIFNVDLSFGSNGPEVTKLQNRLKEFGFFPTNVASTGYFGNVTRAAVINFQKRFGINPAVGFFGQITRAKINSL